MICLCRPKLTFEYTHGFNNNIMDFINEYEQKETEIKFEFTSTKTIIK